MTDLQNSVHFYKSDQLHKKTLRHGVQYAIHRAELVFTTQRQLRPFSQAVRQDDHRQGRFSCVDLVQCGQVVPLVEAAENRLRASACQVQLDVLFHQDPLSSARKNDLS